MTCLPHIFALFWLALANLSAAAAATDSTTLENYPRPQLARPDWVNLNGQWDYAIAKQAAVAKVPTEWAGKIKVPADANSAAAGIDQKVGADQQIWYRRSIPTPKLKVGQRALLRFEAAGWEAQIFVNGALMSLHQGSNTPFHLDLTRFLKKDAKTQEIAVAVWNPDAGMKDALPTGLWQTVWMEIVPHSYINELVITPNPAAGEVKVLAKIWGQANFRELEMVALDGAKEVTRGSAFYHYKKGGFEATLKIPDAKLWTPESPKLYGLRMRIANDDGSTYDDVTSYFALRNLELGDKNATGARPILLNGKPRRLAGTDDDNVRGTRADAEIRTEIDGLKAAGFDLVRKRRGLESSRYFFNADQRGLLIWQEAETIHNPRKPDPPKRLQREFAELRTRLGHHPSLAIWPAKLGAPPSGSSLRATDDKTEGELLFSASNDTLPAADGKLASALIASESVHPAYLGAGAAVTISPKAPKGESAAAKGWTTLVAPDAEWSFATSSPGDGWQKNNFEDKGWKKAKPPFGGGAAAVWQDDQLWLRSKFEIADGAAGRVFLKLRNSGEAKVFLDGKALAELPACGLPAGRLILLPELKSGAHTLAIVTESDGEERFVDASVMRLTK